MTDVEFFEEHPAAVRRRLRLCHDSLCFAEAPRMTRPRPEVFTNSRDKMPQVVSKDAAVVLVWSSLDEEDHHGISGFSRCAA